MKPIQVSRMPRRRFLQRTGMGVALFNILPGVVVRGAEPLAANEKLNLAGVGIGSRGGAVVGEAAGIGHNIVALCDIDEKYAAKEFDRYPKARRFKDYRVMLDQMGAGVDGVIIGTPDHTHAIIAMEAMRRGKHVYCEKPLAHGIGEVRRLMAAAREHKVVTQLGNQGHSTDTIRRVCEWIWAGVLGNVHTVHAACDAFPNVYSQIANLPKLAEKHAVPDGLDYDMWVGPAEFRPYSPLWVPWNWRGWMPYGGGAVGDWICHVVDPSFWALDLDAPKTVRAEVTDFDPKVHGLTYPPGSKITFEFAAKGARGPVKLVWHDGKTRIPRPEAFGPDQKVPGTGAIIHGDKAMIVHGSHGGGNCVLFPESLMEQHAGKNAPPEKIARVKGHVWDWAEAIRNGRKAGSDFSYGGPLSQVGLLGLIAIKYPGETLHWDDAAMRFTNHEAANAHVNPPYRAGWTL
ncbi:MAG: Gfo/Idh/MocA family oxidoreductase [Verrucomicrobiales bacterium]|nr:Gfo/Idh/MocA family oxidoreductase [Verrucomicrobiales bacterium]